MMEWTPKDTDYGRIYLAKTPAGEYTIRQEESHGNDIGGWYMDFEPNMVLKDKEGYPLIETAWELPPSEKWKTIDFKLNAPFPHTVTVNKDGTDDFYKNPFQHLDLYDEDDDENVIVQLPFFTQKQIDDFVQKCSEKVLELKTPDMNTWYVDETTPFGEHIRWPAKPFRGNTPINGFSAVKYAKHFAELIDPYHKLIVDRYNQLVNGCVNQTYWYHSIDMNEEEFEYIEEDDESDDGDGWDDWMMV